MIKAFGGKSKGRNSAAAVATAGIASSSQQDPNAESIAAQAILSLSGRVSQATTTTTTTPSYRCPDCGSKNVDIEENGQVTCLGCGYVIVVAQVVKEVEEIHDAVTFNLKNVRTGARKQRGKSTSQLAVEKEKAREQVDLMNLERALQMCKTFSQSLHGLGFTNLDVDKTLKQISQHFQEHKEKALDARKLTWKVMGIVFANLNESVITAWDLSHMANSRMIPILEYGCQERGPDPDHIIEAKNQVPNSYELDTKAVTMRFSVRFARLLDLNVEELWRAAWFVLFGLGGFNGGKDVDAARIAAGVVGSVVLLKNWEKKASNTNKDIPFSFCPYGTFFTNQNLLNAMQKEIGIRNEQFKRQKIALTGLERKPALNSHLKKLFQKKLPSELPLATDEKPIGCDGECLKKFIQPFDDMKSRSISNRDTCLQLNSLQVWERRLDPRSEDEEIQGLITLIAIGERGIDHYVERSKLGKDQRVRFDFASEVRRVVREATKLEMGAQFELFQEDTNRLIQLGCQQILCCPRVFKEKKIQSIPTISEQPPPCGECDNCIRIENCGKCTFCLDKPEYGGLGKRRRVCKLRTCILVEEFRKQRNREYHRQYIESKKARA